MALSLVATRGTAESRPARLTPPKERNDTLLALAGLVGYTGLQQTPHADRRLTESSVTQVVFDAIAPGPLIPLAAAVAADIAQVLCRATSGLVRRSKVERAQEHLFLLPTGSLSSSQMLLKWHL